MSYLRQGVNNGKVVHYGLAHIEDLIDRALNNNKVLDQGKQFVLNLREKIDKYGDGTFLSRKQYDWLCNLANVSEMEKVQ